MKKILIGSFFALISSSVVFAQLGPIEESLAYKRYQSRPQTELSKLIYVMDRFNVPGVEVKVDDSTFSADKVFPFWKVNLRVSYDEEAAEEWIQRYCYRSDDTNEVIYMRTGNEDFKPARDSFLEELNRLRELLK